MISILFDLGVVGGPSLEHLTNVRFKLHNLTIACSLPCDGTRDEEASDVHQVVNYQHELERFNEDFFGGKFYLNLHCALWEYHRKKLLGKIFPEQVGAFEYRLGIAKLREVQSSQDTMTILEKYASEFVKDFLDGPQGVNTQLREDFPSEPDEALTGELGRLLKDFNTTGLNNEWLHFTLFTGYPGRQNREYYLTHLSDEFIVVLELEGTTKSGDAKLNRIVAEKNVEAAATIFNSIRLERHC